MIVIGIVTVTSPSNKSLAAKVWPSLLCPSLRPPARLSELLSGTQLDDLKTTDTIAQLCCIRNVALTHSSRPSGSVTQLPLRLTHCHRHALYLVGTHPNHQVVG